MLQFGSSALRVVAWIEVYQVGLELTGSAVKERYPKGRKIWTLLRDVAAFDIRHGVLSKAFMLQLSFRLCELICDQTCIQ
jgi:hypothetical protein